MSDDKIKVRTFGEFRPLKDNPNKNPTESQTECNSASAGDPEDFFVPHPLSMFDMAAENEKLKAQVIEITLELKELRKNREVLSQELEATALALQTKDQMLADNNMELKRLNGLLKMAERAMGFADVVIKLSGDLGELKCK